MTPSWTFLLLNLLMNRVGGASVLFNGFRFTLSADSDNHGGLHISFKCPLDKWCGVIVSGSMEPEIFTLGDTYILARHGVCNYDCCWNLRGNPAPDYSCPHPNCCTATGNPVGLRSFPSLMGEGWHTSTEEILFPHGYAPWFKPRRQARSRSTHARRRQPRAVAPHTHVRALLHRLRGDATMRPALQDAPPYTNAFQIADVIDGFNLVDLSLPFGVDQNRSNGFHVLDSSMRAVVFTGAARGATSFDDGLTTIDVGYHGPGAFTACLVSSTELCGCGWPLRRAVQLKECVPINSDSEYDADDAYRRYDAYRRVMVLSHGMMMIAAWSVIMPCAVVMPRCWRHALPHRWFQVRTSSSRAAHHLCDLTCPLT